MNTNEYNMALEITKQFLNTPVGYSKYEASSAADQQLIRQNNIIICLLEQIISKLNEKSIKELNESVNDLMKDLTKLNIGSSTTKKTPSKPRSAYTFATFTNSK